MPEARVAGNPPMTARSHAVILALLTGSAVALAVSGRAQPQFTEAYSSAFHAWVQTHRPTTAIVGVRWQRETIFLEGRGVDPRAPTLIGSMSKPITAVCVAKLIDDGKLAFTTPLREALAGFFRRHGPPADRRLESVTIEQLLTHRSGIPGNDEGDPMQDIWRRRAAQGLGHIASPEPLLVRALPPSLGLRARQPRCIYQLRLCGADRGDRGGERQTVRGLLPERRIRPARHRKRAAAPRLEAVLRRARLVHPCCRLPCLSGRVRPVEPVSRRRGEGVDCGHACETSKLHLLSSSKGSGSG